VAANCSQRVEFEDLYSHGAVIALVAAAVVFYQVNELKTQDRRTRKR